MGLKDFTLVLVSNMTHFSLSSPPLLLPPDARHPEGVGVAGGPGGEHAVREARGGGGQGGSLQCTSLPSEGEVPDQ